jgi:hypothetical protein
LFLLTALAAVSALIASMLATGASGGQPTGHVYVSSDPVPVGVDVVTQVVFCPEGTEVTGGGVSISGPASVTIEVNSSFPLDGPDFGETPEDGWQGSGSNGTGTAQSMIVWAICSTITNVHIYMVKQDVAGPVQTFEAEPVCPEGQDVVGGGIGTTGSPTHGHEVAATYPTDSTDAGSTPEDAWRSALNNRTGSNTPFLAYAICQPAGFPHLTYAHNSRNVFEGTQAGSLATCPDGTEVAGGGVAAIGDPLAAEIGTMYPVDLSDSGNEADDGYQGWMNSEQGLVVMDTWAVCAPTGPPATPSASGSPSASASPSTTVSPTGGTSPSVGPSPSPSPSASPTEPPTRTVTLSLSGHLNAHGLVDSDREACWDNATVKLQRKRKKGGWKTVRSTHADDGGSYEMEDVNDRTGRYRAKVKESTVDGNVCPTAVSRTLRHKHQP